MDNFWGRWFTILMLIFVFGGVQRLAGEQVSSWFASGVAFSVFYFGMIEYLENRGGGQ